MSFGCSLQANSLLQAKVDMLRDNVKQAARVTASEKAALESEVAQLKQQLAASGRSRSGFASRSTSQVLDGEAHAVKQTRSLSEDGGSQSQLWMQLVRWPELYHFLKTDQSSIPEHLRKRIEREYVVSGLTSERNRTIGRGESPAQFPAGECKCSTGRASGPLG